MYAYIENNIIRSTIPDFDPIFPNVPVEDRYSPEFLSKCEHFGDGEVAVGMVRQEDGSWAMPDAEPIPETLEEVKAAKFSELDNACQQTIYAGADVVLSSGEVQHFTLDEQDQSNLLGLTNQLIMGATQISWHNDDKFSACQFYSAEDASRIINTLSVYKSYHITYCKDLRIYVNSLESASEVNVIEYGFALPESSKSDVLKYYEQIIAGA